MKKTRTTHSKNVSKFDKLFSAARKAISDQRLAGLQRAARRHLQSLKTAEREATKLKQLIEEATATIRSVVSNGEQIQDALIQKLRRGGVTVFPENLGEHGKEPGLLFGKRPCTIALSVRQDEDGLHNLLFAIARNPKTKLARKWRAGFAERLSVRPVETGHEPAYGMVWREVRVPSTALMRQLARLKEPSEAIRALAEACE